MIGKILLFIYLVTVVTNLWFVYNMKERIKKIDDSPEEFDYMVNILFSFIPIFNIKYIIGTYYLCICKEEELKKMLNMRREGDL